MLSLPCKDMMQVMIYWGLVSGL